MTIHNNFVHNGTFESHRPGVAGNDWRHTQAWHDWGRGEAWHHDGFHHHRHFDFDDFVFFNPGWYGLWGWPYYNDYGWGWPVDYYAYDNGWNNGLVSYPAPDEGPIVQQPVVEGEQEVAQNDQNASLGEQYAEEAQAAFREGNYREALRMGGHAAIESPRDPSNHELMSLSLFALKDYRGAAMEAHAALSLGPPIDWPTLFSYYGNVETYTQQLRALEAFVRENPKKAEGHFLLGYQYTMTGVDKDAAKKEVSEAIAITPNDKIAESLSKQLGTEEAATSRRTLK
jgi:tetratricopeptide (TPR) repeat protein